VSTSSRTRNRRGEGGRLRTDILTAATGLLDRGGERAVTLRAVAREAGIATPSIYPHFPDRPAILLAVVRAAVAELAHRLETAAPGEDARQRLYAAGHAYLDFATTHPRRYRAMFGAACGLTELDVLVPRFFAGVLTDCVVAGDSASTDPVTDAVALWLGLHGLAHQHTVIQIFPWSTDLVTQVVTALAHIVH
jgi:AcrR family transcriptional regulator